MTFGYDFSDAEEMGDFVTLTPGRYIFALQSVEKGESASGNPKAVLRFRVVAGNPAYEGGVISAHWPVTGKGAFRFRAMLKAFGVKFSDKGKVNLQKYIDEEFGARVSLTEGKERNEAGEIIYFHELNAILPSSQYADLLDGSVDEDEDEEEELEDEEVEEEDDEEDDGEPITVEDLDEMNLAELKELAEEWEVSTKPDKGKTKVTQAMLRKRLAAVIEEAEEEEEDGDEDEDEEDEELTSEDLEAMTLAELKELAAENKVKLPKVAPGKKQSAAKVRAALVAALFPDDEEDEDDDEEEPF